jgi:hypothetical protein
MFQLADVSRPAVVHERGKSVLLDPLYFAFRLIGKFSDEMIDQHGYIFRSLAQRRQSNPDDIEAVVEILAESTLLNQLFQVTVTCRNQPRIHLLALVGSQRPHFVFNDAQQLGLQIERISLISSRKSTPRWLVETSAAVFAGVSKSATDDQKLAFQQRFGMAAQLRGTRVVLSELCRWMARAINSCRSRFRPRSTRWLEDR